jgi:superoxide dismutase, Fe-Mn family
MAISRREAIVETGSALALLGGIAAATRANAASIVRPLGVAAAMDPVSTKHKVVSLPFDAKKLKGLSERMVVSHHDNNYAGAVNNLNKVEDELARVNKDTPAYLVFGLRERELTFGNSMTLHEHYFANLGGDGKSQGPVAKAIAEGFGGMGRWEELFRATGMSLSGGSGWVVLAHSFARGGLHITWSSGHPQALAFAAPILIMDMYEHAYQMDFGAAAGKYIDAFFANIKWDEVNRRHERALAMSKVPL